MLPLDATELYDLSEAGRRLLTGPGRIRRWIRQGRAPGVRKADGWHVPRAWVDAASGTVAADAEGIREYWLERLAPPSLEAVRPLKDRCELPIDDVLTPEEAAARVFADGARLRRLGAEGTLPALRIDGSLCYDARIVELTAHEGLEADGPQGSDARPDAEARRAEVRDWALYDYAAGLDQGREPPPVETVPAPENAVAAAPHAWRIPKEIEELALPAPEALQERTDPAAPEASPMPEESADPTEKADPSVKADPAVKAEPTVEAEPAAEPEPGETDEASRLIRADGFETVDEDP